MKLRNTLKAAAALTITVMLSAAGIYAAGSSSVIDPSRKASLTICKIRENAGTVYVTNGKAGALSGYSGMSGIRFGILRIAEITQKVSGEGTGTRFTNPDAGFMALLAQYGISVPSENNGTWFDADALSDALGSLCMVSSTPTGEQKLTEFVKNHAKTVHLSPTGTDGIASASDLPLGLYLIVEEDSSGYRVKAGVTEEIAASASNPMLVSLPFTDKESVEKDGAWVYDVTVYPKDRTVSIPKYIVSEDDQDTLLLAEDYEIGETIRQILTPGVPAVTHLTDKDKTRNYTSYIISDTMEAGLSFKKLIEVKLGPLQKDPGKLSAFNSFQPLAEGVDYRILKGDTGETVLNAQNAAGTHSFRIVFTADGLAKLNARTGESQVVVVFESVLTRSAKDGGGEANKNRPALTIKNAAGQEAVVRGNEPEVFTYRLNIKKTGVQDASKVSFSVAKKAGEVHFAKESDGVYHVWDRDLDSAEAVAEESVIRPKADGTLQIRGLDADTYTFTEKTTESGHELLKSTFSVTLTGNKPANGKLKDAYITSDGASAQIGISGGTAGFAVDNIKALILRTGGRGTGMIYFIGAVILLAGGVLFGVRRLRRE